jgi:hypothetical protein
MSVTYTTPVKNARLDAVATQIGNAGKLEIGTSGMASVLATITLNSPAAPAASGGVLTLFNSAKTATAAAGGTAAAARIRTSANVDIVTGLTVGSPSGFDVNLDSTSISSGQTVQINSATITHA